VWRWNARRAVSLGGGASEQAGPEQGLDGRLRCEEAFTDWNDGQLAAPGGRRQVSSVDAEPFGVAA
jgi:hypothetical protein